MYLQPSDATWDCGCSLVISSDALREPRNLNFYVKPSDFKCWQLILKMQWKYVWESGVACRPLSPLYDVRHRGWTEGLTVGHETWGPCNWLWSAWLTEGFRVASAVLDLVPFLPPTSLAVLGRASVSFWVEWGSPCLLVGLSWRPRWWSMHVGREKNFYLYNWSFWVWVTRYKNWKSP